MTASAKRVLEDALELSPEERADLAATLLDSLEEAQDEGVEEAWAEEIARRIRDVESGAVQTIPWSEARRRLYEILDARKRS
jgi:putative addiction module component (TIGR02574 family)